MFRTNLPDNYSDLVVHGYLHPEENINFMSDETTALNLGQLTSTGSLGIVYTGLGTSACIDDDVDASEFGALSSSSSVPVVVPLVSHDPVDGAADPFEVELYNSPNLKSGVNVFTTTGYGQQYEEEVMPVYSLPATYDNLDITCLDTYYSENSMHPKITNVRQFLQDKLNEQEDCVVVGEKKEEIANSMHDDDDDDDDGDDDGDVESIHQNEEGAHTSSQCTSKKTMESGSTPTIKQFKLPDLVSDGLDNKFTSIDQTASQLQYAVKRELDAVRGTQSEWEQFSTSMQVHFLATYNQRDPVIRSPLGVYHEDAGRVVCLQSDECQQFISIHQHMPLLVVEVTREEGQIPVKVVNLFEHHLTSSVATDLLTLHLALQQESRVVSEGSKERLRSHKNTVKLYSRMTHQLYELQQHIIRQGLFTMTSDEVTGRGCVVGYKMPNAIAYLTPQQTVMKTLDQLLTELQQQTVHDLVQKQEQVLIRNKKKKRSAPNDVLAAARAMGVSTQLWAETFTDDLVHGKIHREVNRKFVQNGVYHCEQSELFQWRCSAYYQAQSKLGSGGIRGEQENDKNSMVDVDAIDQDNDDEKKRANTQLRRQFQQCEDGRADATTYGLVFHAQGVGQKRVGMSLLRTDAVNGLKMDCIGKSTELLGQVYQIEQFSGREQVHVGITSKAYIRHNDVDLSTLQPNDEVTVRSQLVPQKENKQLLVRQRNGFSIVHSSIGTWDAAEEEEYEQGMHDSTASLHSILQHTDTSRVWTSGKYVLPIAKPRGMQTVNGHVRGDATLLHCAIGSDNSIASLAVDGRIRQYDLDRLQESFVAETAVETKSMVDHWWVPGFKNVEAYSKMTHDGLTHMKTNRLPFPAWGTVKFSHNPHVLLGATRSDVFSVDTRISASARQWHSSRLPLQLRPEDRELTAMEVSPIRPFQYCIATKERVLLLDQRMPRDFLACWQIPGYPAPRAHRSYRNGTYRPRDIHVAPEIQKLDFIEEKHAVHVSFGAIHGVGTSNGAVVSAVVTPREEWLHTKLRNTDAVSGVSVTNYFDETTDMYSTAPKPAGSFQEGILASSYQHNKQFLMEYAVLKNSKTVVDSSSVVQRKGVLPLHPPVAPPPKTTQTGYLMNTTMFKRKRWFCQPANIKHSIQTKFDKQQEMFLQQQRECYKMIPVNGTMVGERNLYCSHYKVIVKLKTQMQDNESNIVAVKKERKRNDDSDEDDEDDEVNEKRKQSEEKDFNCTLTASAVGHADHAFPTNTMEDFISPELSNAIVQDDCREVSIGSLRAQFNSLSVEERNMLLQRGKVQRRVRLGRRGTKRAVSKPSLVTGFTSCLVPMRVHARQLVRSKEQVESDLRQEKDVRFALEDLFTQKERGRAMICLHMFWTGRVRGRRVVWTPKMSDESFAGIDGTMDGNVGYPLPNPSENQHLYIRNGEFYTPQSVLHLLQKELVVGTGVRDSKSDKFIQVSRFNCVIQRLVTTQNCIMRGRQLSHASVQSRILKGDNVRNVDLETQEEVGLLDVDPTLYYRLACDGHQYSRPLVTRFATSTIAQALKPELEISTDQLEQFSFSSFVFKMHALRTEFLDFMQTPRNGQEQCVWVAKNVQEDSGVNIVPYIASTAPADNEQFSSYPIHSSVAKYVLTLMSLYVQFTCYLHEHPFSIQVDKHKVNVQDMLTECGEEGVFKIHTLDQLRRAEGANSKVIPMIQQQYTGNSVAPDASFFTLEFVKEHEFARNQALLKFAESVLAETGLDFTSMQPTFDMYCHPTLLHALPSCACTANPPVFAMEDLTRSLVHQSYDVRFSLFLPTLCNSPNCVFYSQFLFYTSLPTQYQRLPGRRPMQDTDNIIVNTTDAALESTNNAAAAHEEEDFMFQLLYKEEEVEEEQRPNAHSEDQQIPDVPLPVKHDPNIHELQQDMDEATKSSFLAMDVLKNNLVPCIVNNECHTKQQDTTECDDLLFELADILLQQEEISFNMAMTKQF